MKATNNYKLVVDDVAQLEGMPKGQLEAALEAGKADKATEGKYVFTIHLPSMEPFLMNCKIENLVKNFDCLSTRCSSDSLDNSEIINEIVNLRLERANILDFLSRSVRFRRLYGKNAGSCKQFANASLETGFSKS